MKRPTGIAVTAYGQVQCFVSKKKAINFYLECMAMSEGAERERYTNIYFALLAGATRINSDKEDWGY